MTRGLTLRRKRIGRVTVGGYDDPSGGAADDRDGQGSAHTLAGVLRGGTEARTRRALPRTILSTTVDENLRLRADTRVGSCEASSRPRAGMITPSQSLPREGVSSPAMFTTWAT